MSFSSSFSSSFFFVAVVCFFSFFALVYDVAFFVCNAAVVFFVANVFVFGLIVFSFSFVLPHTYVVVFVLSFSIQTVFFVFSFFDAFAFCIAA